MNTTISKFLKEHYVDGVFHTHVSLIKPTGKFQLNRESMEKLWDIYSNFVDNEDEVLGIGEKPTHYLPVLCDIDIKIEGENNEYSEKDHIYNEKNVNDIIQIYQSILRNIVQDCTDDNLLCVVLEKPIYSITKNDIVYYKNGFHLHFPNCFLRKTDQELHLIPRVQDCAKEMKVFENLGFEDSGSLIDKSCCKVHWLMYGSVKNENSKPYKVTRMVNSECKNISLEEGFKYYQLFDIKENLIDMKGDYKKYLPRILSILPYGRSCQELKLGLSLLQKEKTNKDEFNLKKQNKNFKTSVAKNLKISERLLPMLSQYRVDDYNEWMTVGWILYSVGEGCLEALDQWLEFSSRSEKYNEEKCIYEWERMVKKDFTLGTLRYYAEKDNEKLYQEFKGEQSQENIRSSLEGSHHDIAKLLYTEFCNRFVCASIANKTWYEFKEHHWNEIEEGVYLRKLISEDIVEKYIDEGCKLFQKVATHDKGEENMYQTKIKQVQKLISNLKNSSYKNNIMREACEVFYNENFKNKLDMNPYLIGFKNGVYDLKLNEFRAGRPEDFISKHMPVNYIVFNNNDERVKNVHAFLEKIFPDTSVRKYFMNQSSDVFVGGNYQKVACFWTGDGDNGKSVTQTIFEKMFGEYSVKFSTSLVTGKKGQMGAASPELARAGGGVRWAVLEEPDGDEQINIGLLKSLTGNDSYFARDLFEKGKSTREISPLFKLVFICNQLPSFRGCTTDPAAWNRVKVIPFESTFVRPGDNTKEPAPDSYEEQLLKKRFPMDMDFYKKIPDLLEPFAWVLLEHRKHIRDRVEPEKVTIATKMYKRQNDIYRQFIDESIIESKSSISLIELYNNFKEWYRQGFPNHTIPVKNDIKEYFTKLWDEPAPGIKWYGYRIRTIEDDINDGNAIILEDEDFENYEEDK